MLNFLKSLAPLTSAISDLPLCGRSCGCAFKFSVKESWWHRGNSSINFSGTPDYFTSQDQMFFVAVDRVLESWHLPEVQSLGACVCRCSFLNMRRLNTQEPGQETIDCVVLGPAGHAISGDLSLLSKLNFDSDARYIIIVEKDAIFQRLAEDRLYNKVPSILITAKGYPDIAARSELSSMVEKGH